MFLLVNKSYAQDLNRSNYFSKSLRIDTSQNFYPLDSQYIYPSSLQIFNFQEQSDQFDVRNNGIEFTDSTFLHRFHGDTLIVKYRVMPFSTNFRFTHLDTTLLRTKDQAIYIGYDYQQENKKSKIIEPSGIDYDGSFSRGFSLGNNQSLLLNSNFNMQLSGDLGDGILIRAAISDDNIPIQPEGNTRLLQEFDKVYINVSKDGSSITAGDYELNRPKSYFINYNKQVQGLSALYQSKEKLKNQLKSKTSFAVSRAIFNRLEVPIVEANQGPYKLPGKNGERFVIIEAGSEKIYEDGKLLTRGQNHDYIISYDRAEIVFTEKKLITKDSRIIAEYEYVDRSYLRTMYATESSLSGKKYDLRLNFYSQQDSKSLSGDSQLDSTDLFLLRMIGDDLDNAQKSGIREADFEFDEDQIRYFLTEDSILIHTNNPDSALYVATFSEVSFGEGQYIIDGEINSNGRVYKYAGESNGNYIPSIKLIAPQKNQILSLGGEFRPSKNTLIESELSLSSNDLNRFSAVNNEDNIGTAAFIRLQQNFRFGKQKRFDLSPFLSIEQKHKNFKELNPYRATEFQRDWNLDPIDEKTEESLLNSGLKFSLKEFGNALYRFGQFHQKGSYKGTRHILNYRFNVLGFELTSTSSLLHSESTSLKTNFFRPILGISKKLGSKSPWTLGYTYEAEKNEKQDLLTQEFLSNSASFRVHRMYLNAPETSNFKLGIYMEDRIDQAIENQLFETYSNAQDFGVQTRLITGPKSVLNIDFTLRNLEVSNNALAEERNVQAKRSYLGQIDYGFDLLNGFLRSSTSFNLGSGQQSKLEFDYQEVQPGEGNYDWIDINMDGVQQLAEFRLSEFQDTSSYIQVPLFNNEFIQTNNSGINQSLRVDFKKLFLPKSKKPEVKKKELENKESLVKKPKPKYPKLKKALKNGISKISSNTTFRISKKVEIDDQDYNPIDFSISDSTIVNYTSFINHTFFINRGNPAWDLQLGYKENRSKLSLVSSIENRAFESKFVRFRNGIYKTLDVILELSLDQKEAGSLAFGQEDLTAARSINIESQRIKPQLNFRPNQKLRFIGSYQLLRKEQTVNSLENLSSHDFSLSSSFRQASRSSWDNSLSFIKVDLNTDDPNSYVSLELLEGLREGNNFIWRSSFTRRLANNVDLIINYEGRKTGENRPVHTGRAQVKATF